MVQMKRLGLCASFGLSKLTTKRWMGETQAATGLTLLSSTKRMTKVHSGAGLTIHRILTSAQC